MSVLKLEEKVSATLEHEEDETMKGYIEGSQLDRSGRTPWPVRDAPSTFEDGELKLRHSEADKANGVRAFFRDILDALKCHQDLQIANDDATLRSYVAKYVSKFSDSMLDEYLTDAGSGDSIAMNILFRYKPMEPEMVLQMCGARYRQWELGTVNRGRRRFLVPVPDAEFLPKIVQKYEESAWRRQGARKMSLLDFLRKSNDVGEITKFLKVKHQLFEKELLGMSEDAEVPTLAEFAADYIMQGERVVACDMLSRMNDRHFGQWALLHVPFDHVEDLMHKDDRLPDTMKYLGSLVLSESPVAKHFVDNLAVEMGREMQEEARSPSEVAAVVNLVEGNVSMIRDYLAGKIRHHDHEDEDEKKKDSDDEPLSRLLPPPAGHRWEPEQQRFMNLVNEAVDRALEIQKADSCDDVTDLVEEHGQKSKIEVCFGPPGSGKTTIAHECVRRVLEMDGEVLFATPTAQLASRMKERYGDLIQIDTCHAAFGLNEEVTEAPGLAHFTLIVVDEVSQLSAAHFEKIRRLWNSVGNLPVMVWIGDPWQMSGLEDQRPWEAPSWKRSTRLTKLVKSHRISGDRPFADLLDDLRVNAPCAASLKKLKKMKYGKGNVVDASTVRQLLIDHPDTTMLALSRRGADMLNDLALFAKFPRREPEATIPVDPSILSENYDPVTKDLYSDARRLRLPEMPLYVGMSVYITVNVCKETDFVNGMRGTVESFDHRTKCVRVVTATNKRIAVALWTNRDLGWKRYYPLRPGYASTILKFQGAELPHVSVFLDAPLVPGAAYTAISRVKRSQDCCLLGEVGEKYFRPVDVRL